jgi:hypothetical protein
MNNKPFNAPSTEQEFPSYDLSRLPAQPNKISPSIQQRGMSRREFVRDSIIGAGAVGLAYFLNRNSVSVTQAHNQINTPDRIFEPQDPYQFILNSVRESVEKGETINAEAFRGLIEKSVFPTREGVDTVNVELQKGFDNLKVITSPNADTKVTATRSNAPINSTELNYILENSKDVDAVSSSEVYALRDISNDKTNADLFKLLNNAGANLNENLIGGKTQYVRGEFDRTGALTRLFFTETISVVDSNSGNVNPNNISDKNIFLLQSYKTQQIDINLKGKTINVLEPECDLRSKLMLDYTATLDKTNDGSDKATDGNDSLDLIDFSNRGVVKAKNLPEPLYNQLTSSLRLGASSEITFAMREQ